MTIKTIDIHAKEWRNRHGNSYFSAVIILDYGTPEETRIDIPAQYGYGDHYKTVAGEVLGVPAKILWQWCADRGVILRCHKETGCLKREVYT
jgi:hypothetical protein